MRTGLIVACLAVAAAYVLDLFVLAVLGDEAKAPVVLVVQAVLVWIGPLAVAAIACVGMYWRVRHPEAGLGRVATLAGVIVFTCWVLLMPAYWRTLADINAVLQAAPHVAPADARTGAGQRGSTSRPALQDDRHGDGPLRST